MTEVDHIIINKFNVHGIPIYNQPNKYMHKYVELILEFKFNKNDDIVSRVVTITERLQTFNKLNKFLNIYYYRNHSVSPYYNNNKEKYEMNTETIDIILDDYITKIYNDTIIISFGYDIPDNNQIVNNRYNFHVKYLEYSLEKKSMLYYLIPLLDHIDEYHQINRFNHIGELEINL
jgi:uncharacterized protein with von Willebrand factor type A (vWA) domain